MKRLSMLLLAVGVVTLAGLFFTHHRHSSVVPPAPAVALGANPASALAAAPVASKSPPQLSVKAPPAAAAAPTNALAIFDDFSRWAGQYTNGTVSLMDGERLAWQRHEAMLDLIQHHPDQALALAVPFAMRQKLPAAITRFLEQQVDGRGDYGVMVATDFSAGNTATYRTVALGGQRFQAFVYGRRLAQVSQTGIPLHGVALAGKLAVSTEPLRVLSEAEAAMLDPQAVKAAAVCSVSGEPARARGQAVYAESGGAVMAFCGPDHFELVNRQWTLAESGGTAATGGAIRQALATSANDNWTHGRKNLLYMRVNFPDDLTEPISAAAANAVMDGVNDFYTEGSYDLTSITTTVTPLLTMPQTKGYYSTDPGLLLDDARFAALEAGFDTANYQLDIVALTPVPGYDWGGLGFVHGKGTWLQSMGVGVTAHELGHNYGLSHANLWDTSTNRSGVGPGENLEYGNTFDTMGLAGAGNYQFNANHKALLDWLKADAVQRITTNGVYRIYPFDVPGSLRATGRVYAAYFPKDSQRDYWLEFRRTFTGNPWLENGLMLNWSAWDLSKGGSQLVDTTPGSPDASDSLSRDDAAVVIGRTFNDPLGSGVHLTPLQRGASGTEPWIDFQVNLGAFPTNQPPVLAVEVDQTQVESDALVHFHATATDPNGDTLAYAWTFDDLTFSTNNLPWIAKSFTEEGDHVVRCVVSDMKGGVASANAVVRVGAANGFRITGRVTDGNGAPLEGVLVGNGEVLAPLFIGGYTDSDGRYVIANIPAEVTLQAFQFGYTLTNAGWVNPVSPTNDVAGIDFVGWPLTRVTVTADTNAIPESDGSAHVFTFTRTGDTNFDLPVNFALAGTATVTADYTIDPALSTTNVVTIPAGSNSVSFVFQVVNDAVVEGPETIVVTLLDDFANAGNPAYVPAAPAEASVTILDDDSPVKPVVTVATTTPQISENGMDAGQLVFTRSGSTAGDLLVNYSLSGTATVGVDYVAPAGVVLIPAGRSTAVVALSVIDDKVVEPDETVTATIAANAAYAVGSPSAATITILDDDFMTVTIVPTGDAAEPGTAGSFTVKRDGDLTEALVVNYVVSGTASNGVDYAALSGTVTIPAGHASADIRVTPQDDSLLEGDETVTLALASSVNYDVGTPGSATLLLRDNEKTTVSFAGDGGSVSEQGDTPGHLVLQRTGTTGNLTVYFAVSGTATSGSDYVPLDNPVVIPDGASSVTIDVIPFHDLILEPTESVILTLQSNDGYSIGSRSTAQVDITDDGTSQVPGVGFCFSTTAITEGQSPGIAVTLSQTSTVPVTVDYKVIGGTAPGSRYSLPPGTLTIPASNWVAMIPLQIADDTVVEPAQTIRVALFNPTNATLDGIKIHTYTILDDDACAVSVTATAPGAAETGPVAGNFRIARTGSTNASQVVNFQVTGTASAPTDFTPLGTSATIPAGATFVDLPVVPVDDGTAEFAQTVVLTLTSATNATILTPYVATVTIADNDTNNLPVVTVTSTQQPYAVEGGVAGTFLFTRTGATTNALTISFTTGGTAAASRYVAFGNTITIPVGQASAALAVTAIDDTQVEGEQTVTVSLTEADLYRTAYPAFATVTIQDNDQRVGLEASDFRASKYGNDPGQFICSRFGTTNTPVTVYYTISGTAVNGVDYATIPGSLVIPAGQLTATLPVLPLHNGVVKGPVTVTLTLQSNSAYLVGGPTNGTVTIDDDMPMLTVTNIVSTVLEGTGSNGVFRVTRTGDPQYDFIARIAIGGTATFGEDYPAFTTNLYFSCGITAIDLLISPTNEVVVEGDETVTATILPSPVYTILSPSNAVLTITDAGANQTPVVLITSPKNYLVFLNGTNAGLVLDATVIDDNPSNTVFWTKVSGPDSYVFGNSNAASTTVLFTNVGAYTLRLTADDGLLQGHADILVFVSNDVLSATNILHWTLDDGTGTNVLDASGAGRDGVFSGGSPAWDTNGVIAGALSFAGTNDCVRQAAGSNVLNGLNAFTISLWLKPALANTEGGFLTADDGGTNATFSLAAKTFAACGEFTNVVEATIPTTQGVVHRTSASNALKPGQWQHVALTWTNGGEPKLYFNGQLDQPEAGFVAAFGALANCPQFIIGKGAADSPASWHGGMDDVRVFAKALSAEEILSLADGAVLNHAPVVDAGTNVAVQLGGTVMLTGTVTDDGLPNPPAAVTNFWTYLGTNNITIADPASLTNAVVFATPGDYIFRLTAFDGELTTFADVTITVLEPTQISISASDGDASELGPDPGQFTVSRNGDTNEMTIFLAISGTASNGVDYVEVPASVTFAAGETTTNITVTPILDDRIEGDETVVLTVLTNIAYSVSGDTATVTIHDSPYGLWSIQHFTLEELTFPNLSGAAADFDSDGVRNFSEYAFNLDPKVPDANATGQWGFETSTNDLLSHLTFTYTRRLPPRDVQYGVFVSTDLLNWNTGTNYVETFSQANDANGFTETVKTRALQPFPGTTNLFMQLRVWLEQVPVTPP